MHFSDGRRKGNERDVKKNDDNILLELLSLYPWYEVPNGFRNIVVDKSSQCNLEEISLDLGNWQRA